MSMNPSQRGFMLLVVPVVLVSICILGVQMVSRSRTSMRVAASDLNYLHVDFCAKRCLALTTNRIQLAMEQSRILAAGSNACRCGDGITGEPTECSVEKSEFDEQNLRACYGYYRKNTRVDLAASCVGSGLMEVNLRGTVDLAEVPIFQFAVFYDKYLEIGNHPPMQIGGRIHSNDTIALDPHIQVSIQDWVTTPKTILARSGGQIQFASMAADDSPIVVKPSEAVFRPLHSVVPGWTDWLKRHRVAYGGAANGCGEVQELAVPIPDLEDNVDLIEWRDPGDDNSLRRQKYSWKASLIYNDGWKSQNLRPVTFATEPIRPPTSPAGWRLETVDGIQRVVFWEGREQIFVKLIPLDVEAFLQRSSSDSLVYLYDDWVDPSQGGRSAGGFLLYNGHTLTRAQTFATNNRLFVLGDFNTDSAYSFDGERFPFPASLISDHMTMLSNDFLPAEHEGPLPNGGSNIQIRRPGAQTSLNACVMTGVTQAGRNQPFSWGGYENLVRLLEDWRNTPFNYSGSSVCLWFSKHSREAWGGGYYYPPIRNFSFSRMYDSMKNMPPGTPRVVEPFLNDRQIVRE